MTIYRVKHQRDFIILHKGALENPNLSFKAKGLWAYCMSKPDDWVFNVKHLATVSQDKKESVCAAIKELELEGYIIRTQGRDKGKFSKVDYEINEIQIILPQRQKPAPVLPLPENPPLLSIDPNQGLKEKAAAGAAPKKQAAATSIEFQIKKSRIPKEEQGAALEFFRDNPDKFKNARNPIALLITIVDAGDHRKNIKDPEIIAIRELWGAAHEWTGPMGSHCCTKEGFVITNGPKTTVYKWDGDDEFWKSKGIE